MPTLETIIRAGVTAAGACAVGIRGVVGVDVLVGARSHRIDVSGGPSLPARSSPRPEG